MLTWKQYLTVKNMIDKGVDEFTALGAIGAAEIPIIGPILIAAAGGLLKWGLKYLLENVIPHEFQPTLETDPDWVNRLAKGEGVPLSPDVDPESWTKEGRMKWQKPENRKIFEDLKKQVQAKEMMDKLLVLEPKIANIVPPVRDIIQYLDQPMHILVEDTRRPQYLDHPYSYYQGNSAYPGAVGGNAKRNTGKILTVNDMIRNKRERK